MKVKELIEKISKHDWDSEIVIDFHENKDINYICEGNEKKNGKWVVVIGISSE